MGRKKALPFLTVGLICFAVSFILLVINVKMVLEQTILLENIIAFSVLSLVIGAIAGGLFFMPMKLAFYSFIGGIGIGYISLYTQTLKNTSGWEDLFALLSLFVWIIIGLVVGLILQFILWIIQKRKMSES